MKKMLLAAAAVLALSGCVILPPEPPPEYGPAPIHYDAAIYRYFDSTLKDPDSVKYRSLSQPRQGEFSRWVGVLFAHDGRKYNYGWLVDIGVNAKNSFGGYTGFHTYEFLFHGELIDDVRDVTGD